MAAISFIPEWFFVYRLFFCIAFALITLAVSIYSFRVYRLSGQRQSKLFGAAFLLFSISYFIQFFLNLSILSEINERIISWIDFQQIITLNNFSMLVHMFFFILGLVTLFYMVLNLKNDWLYFGMAIISILFLLISANKVGFFFILSSLLLVVISIYYLEHSVKTKNSKSLLMVIAFFLLLIGHIHFIFLVNSELEYVLGSFLELGAYILILINFLKALKK